MEVNNYSLATKPYIRGFGDKTTTVVEIRLQDGEIDTTPIGVNWSETTQDKEETLIQSVLDILKSELDPGSAIVQAQSKKSKAS